jgi:hypothetical protein
MNVFILFLLFDWERGSEGGGRERERERERALWHRSFSTNNRYLKKNRCYYEPNRDSFLGDVERES